MPIGSLLTRARPTAADFGIERVDWAEIGPDFLRSWGWPNGRYDPEHLTVYGKSGGGKSYFVSYVLRWRAYLRGSHVVVVCTKPADKTISAMGWPILTKWPPDYNQHQVIFWAKAKGLSPEAKVPQRVAIKKLMDTLWTPNSNIVVYWDELTYIEQNLRLKDEIATFYREGRALGITNVASVQRPAYVSRLIHSEAGWTIAFPPKDQDDAKRVAEVLGDRQTYMHVMRDLDSTKHEFLIRHDLTGEAYITHLPPPPNRTDSTRPKAGRPSGRAVSRSTGYGVRSARR